MISVVEGHPHDFVACNAEELLLLLPVELDHKEGDSIVWERLPGLDEVHLGLEQVQILDVGVSLQNALAELQE